MLYSNTNVLRPTSKDRTTYFGRHPRTEPHGPMAERGSDSYSATISRLGNCDRNTIPVAGLQHTQTGYALITRQDKPRGAINTTQPPGNRHSILSPTYYLLTQILILTPELGYRTHPCPVTRLTVFSLLCRFKPKPTSLYLQYQFVITLQLIIFIFSSCISASTSEDRPHEASDPSSGVPRFYIGAIR